MIIGFTVWFFIHQFSLAFSILTVSKRGKGLVLDRKTSFTTCSINRARDYQRGQLEKVTKFLFMLAIDKAPQGNHRIYMIFLGNNSDFQIYPFPPGFFSINHSFTYRLPQLSHILLGVRFVHPIMVQQCF